MPTDIDPPLLPFLQALLHSEWRSTLRQGQLIFLPVAFLLLIWCLWPLALPAQWSVLQTTAPAIAWMSILLSLILTLDRLFSADISDGAIIHWFESAYSLVWLVLVRMFIVSVVFASAVSLAAPVLMLLYQLSWQSLLTFLISVWLGIPSLIAVGAVVSALLIGVGQRTMLLPLLIVPLWVPILIFATTSLTQQSQGLSVVGHFALLGACLLIAVCCAPFAVAAALRLSLE